MSKQRMLTVRELTRRYARLLQKNSALQGELRDALQDRDEAESDADNLRVALKRAIGGGAEEMFEELRRELERAKQLPDQKDDGFGSPAWRRDLEARANRESIRADRAEELRAEATAKLHKAENDLVEARATIEDLVATLKLSVPEAEVGQLLVDVATELLAANIAAHFVLADGGKKMFPRLKRALALIEKAKPEAVREARRRPDSQPDTPIPRRIEIPWIEKRRKTNKANHDEPNPWHENAVRELEDGHAEGEAESGGREGTDPAPEHAG